MTITTAETIRCRYLLALGGALGRLLSNLLDVETVIVVEDAHKSRNGPVAHPVALELAIHLDAAYEVRSSLLDAPQRCLICSHGSAAYGVNRYIYLKALLNCIESWEGQTGLGPKRGHNEFSAADRLHRLLEVSIFPAIDGSSVIGRQMTYYILQVLDRWFITPSRNVNRRMDDRKVVVYCALATLTMLNTSSSRGIERIEETWIG